MFVAFFRDQDRPTRREPFRQGFGSLVGQDSLELAEKGFVQYVDLFDVESEYAVKTGCLPRSCLLVGFSELFNCQGDSVVAYSLSDLKDVFTELALIC